MATKKTAVKLPLANPKFNSLQQKPKAPVKKATAKLDPPKGEFASLAREMLDAALLAQAAGPTPSTPPVEEKNPTISDFQARMFRLHRHEDHTGSTGDGVVAEGIEWTDGTVTVRWKHGDTTNHTNLKTLATMHFNRGSTVLIWM